MSESEHISVVTRTWSLKIEAFENVNEELELNEKSDIKFHAQLQVSKAPAL